AIEDGEIAGALGFGRHRRVGIERVARMVAGVVDEEKCARAVDDLRDDERSAHRGAETLLQIIRLRRRLPVERVRRGVERRRSGALVDGAADRLAGAATEPAAEGPAANAAAPAETAWPAARSEAACGFRSARAARLARRAIGAAKSLREVAWSVAAEDG